MQIIFLKWFDKYFETFSLQIIITMCLINTCLMNLYFANISFLCFMFIVLFYDYFVPKIILYIFNIMDFLCK